MNPVVVFSVVIVFGMCTIWLITYSLLVAWWRTVYGRMLFSLVASLWLVLLSPVHDSVIGHPVPPIVPAVSLILMAVTLGWSWSVMIRDNFYRRGGGDG